MALIVNTFPDSDTFDFEGFYNHIENNRTPSSTIWTDTNPDHRRLPGNSSIFELLLYNGYLFKEWVRSPNPMYGSTDINGNFKATSLNITRNNRIILDDLNDEDKDPNSNTYTTYFLSDPEKETEYNKCYEEKYLRSAGYITGNMSYDKADENIVYSPQYPDNIYSLDVDTIDRWSNRSHYFSGSPDTNADYYIKGDNIDGVSPHNVIPAVISYEITRREPASMVKGKPFGSGKDYKFRYHGVFEGSDGLYYQLRSRWWESLVCFTCISTSGYGAENLCWLFEKFMDLKEGKLLEAGLGKLIPWGRFKEPDVKLENSNLHYRKTYFYFRTQEFQISGPHVSITEAKIETRITSASD